MFININAKATVVRQRAIRTWFVFCIFLVSLSYSNAQQKYFKAYDINDGLPSSTVGAEPIKKPVFQDKDGFIWFATFGGLSIYDGYHFRNYTSANNGITDDIVFNFFERSNDEVWVIESACTDVFVKRKRVRSIPIRGYRLSNYLLIHDGRILTARDGFIFEIKDYKPVRLTTFPYEITKMYDLGNYFLIQDFPHDSLYIVDRSFQKIIAAHKGKIFEDSYQRYWYFDSRFYLIDATALQNGIFRSLPAPEPLNKIDLSTRQITDFLADTDGYYWIIITNEKGVMRIDREGNTRVFDIKVNSLMEDADKNIWIPGDAVFNKFYNKYNDFYTTTDGLQSEHITGIDEDERNGSAWFAYDKGISCIYRNKLYNFPYPANDFTWTSIKAQNDSLWVMAGQLYLFKIFYEPQPRISLLKRWAPLNDDNDFISCMQAEKDGTVMINLQNHGLFRAAQDGKLQKIYDKGLFSFFIDKDELWTGEIKNSVARWKMIYQGDSLHLQLMQRYDNLPGGRINCIAKDPGGNFWMGTIYKGVLKFEKQKDDSFIVHNYYAKHGLSKPWVLKISIDQQGEIYVGTMGGGIFQLHPNKDSVFIDLTAKYGGISATWDFARDSKNNFWLATPVGVIHVNNDLYKRSRPPKVFFNQLLKNNEPDTSIFDTGTNKFSYKENNLVFEFSATSFRNEEKTLYSYRLKNGNDSSQWTAPNDNHVVSLLGLSPGSYSLQIKALTADNVWSEVPAEYNFVITPPFWATFWFRMLLVVMVTAVIYVVYRFRINQLKKLFIVRSKISRDLHDEVGSTLSGIGLLSEVAMQQLNKEKKAEVTISLNKINSNSEEMLEKMSDIVWAINPKNDSFEKVINRLKVYAKSTTDALGIHLHFNSANDLERCTLDMQKRSNVYLICKEAITNAIKYSGCNNLRFALQQENHHINISIADDGKGFNVLQEFEGNGLKNMQSRAKEINADLKMDSENGKGTLINLSLKIR